MSKHARADGGSQEDDSGRWTGGSGKGERNTPWYIEIPIIIAIALLLSIGLQTFIGRVYLIPSESMEPTLHGCADCTGDRIWVNKISTNFRNPDAGDVVVFVAPESWDGSYITNRSQNPVVNSLQTVGSWIGVVAPDENTMVKRVMATGGQTIQCREGDPGIMVDGQMLDQSYIQSPPDHLVDPSTGSEACGGPYFGPITVPEDNIWVMGDNRTNSLDSRYHIGDEYQGTVPVDDVVGFATNIILPFNRISSIDNPDIQAN